MPSLSSLRRLIERRDGQHQTIAGGYPHALAAFQRHWTLHAPLLAANAGPALPFYVFECHADATDQLLVASDNRTPACLQRDATDEEHEQTRGQRERADEP